MINDFLRKVNSLFVVESLQSSPEVKVEDLPIKTVNELIEEIHESFYTEVDKLLAEAKISRSITTDKQNLIDKCKRLESLGFHNTKEVKEAREEIERLDSLRRENEQKVELIEAINYFSFKYPNYKFITEESVVKICEKYNLVYGEIDKYTGTVPDENLKHIENFKVSKNDECYFEEMSHFNLYNGEKLILSKDYVSFNSWSRQRMSFSILWNRFIRKCPLEIAAPLTDFNIEGMKVNNREISIIEIPDPVVLKPVFFKNKKHYLIVTAWGLEASDPLVMNSRHN